MEVYLTVDYLKVSDGYTWSASACNVYVGNGVCLGKRHRWTFDRHQAAINYRR